MPTFCAIFRGVQTILPHLRIFYKGCIQAITVLMITFVFKYPARMRPDYSKQSREML